jgi:type IV secretory pathway protease TraF
MKTARKPKDPMTRKALTALRDAVARVVEKHRREGRPLAVWQDGKAVLVPPGELSLVRERPSAYKTRRRPR